MASIPFHSTHELAEPLHNALLSQVTPAAGIATEGSLNYLESNLSANSSQSPSREAISPLAVQGEAGDSWNAVSPGVLVGMVVAAALLVMWGVLLGVLGTLFVVRGRRNAHHSKQHKRRNGSEGMQSQVRDFLKSYCVLCGCPCAEPLQSTRTEKRSNDRTGKHKRNQC